MRDFAWLTGLSHGHMSRLPGEVPGHRNGDRDSARKEAASSRACMATVNNYRRK